MRVGSRSSITDVFDKLRGDGDTITEADRSTETPKDGDDLTTSLLNIHPSSLTAGSALNVVVQALLMLRDRYCSAKEDDAIRFLNNVIRLNGVVSSPSEKSFHLNFSNHSDVFRISIYDQYIDYSNKDWYMRIHAEFDKDGPKKLHVFPLIKLETGVNHSQLVWDHAENRALCRSDLRDDVLMTLFNYVASIEYHLDIKGSKIVIVKDHVKPTVIVRDRVGSVEL